MPTLCAIMTIDPRTALDAIGQLDDDEIDILDAALRLGLVDGHHNEIRKLAVHASELARNAVGLEDDRTAAGRAAALAKLLAGRHRYQGDAETYDDLANANLPTVIARRKGLPVALGIIWIHTARAAGWTVYGIDFPAHFLIGLEGEKDKIVLDVFNGGTPCDARDLRAMLKRIEGADAQLRPEHLRPMTTRAVLLRLQNNIKLRRLQAGDIDGALACTEDMLRIAPDATPLWYDAAELNQRLERLEGALTCYERLLTLLPDGQAATQTRSTIAELRSRLN